MRGFRVHTGPCISDQEPACGAEMPQVPFPCELWDEATVWSQDTHGGRGFELLHHLTLHRQTGAHST